MKDDPDEKPETEGEKPPGPDPGEDPPPVMESPLEMARKTRIKGSPRLPGINYNIKRGPKF